MLHIFSDMLNGHGHIGIYSPLEVIHYDNS